MESEEWSERMRAVMDAHSVCFGRALISVHDTELVVEVADRAAQHRVGYKWRDEPKSDGMLFMYDENVQWPFTMEHVAFDLDLFWFDEHMNLLGTRTGSANGTPVFPPAEYRYVLEVPAGTLTAPDLAKLQILRR